MSKRDDVLAAVEALIRAALPHAEVKRNMAKPESVPPGGMVIMHEGKPEESDDPDLSPLTYHYEHRIPLEICAFPNGDGTPEAAISSLLTDLGAAIEADRTLGGLVEFFEPEAPGEDDVEVYGAEAGRWADVTLVATYSVAGSPLR
jgi:hypothetical protein